MRGGWTADSVHRKINCCVETLQTFVYLIRVKSLLIKPYYCPQKISVFQKEWESGISDYPSL